MTDLEIGSGPPVADRSRPLTADELAPVVASLRSDAGDVGRRAAGATENPECFISNPVESDAGRSFSSASGTVPCWVAAATA